MKDLKIYVEIIKYGIFRVIGQKVCVESAANLDKYWICSTFIFF